MSTVVAAANEIKRQLLDLASERLEIAQADLELADSAVRVKGSPERSVSIADLAVDAYDSDLLLASIATCLERARAERKDGPRRPRHEQRRRKQ